MLIVHQYSKLDPKGLPSIEFKKKEREKLVTSTSRQLLRKEENRSEE
jgi:hypothetical protein